MGRLLRSSVVLALVALAGGLAPSTADAGLMGSEFRWQFYVLGGPYFYPGGETGGSWIVDGEVGGTFIGGTPFLYFRIIADDTSLTFDYSVTTASIPWQLSPLSLAPTIHTGVAIDLLAGPAFTSVSINPATTMVGFDASRFSFTGTQIQVDWEGLEFDSRTVVKLDVEVVPEPDMLAFLGLGLVLLVLAARRS